MFKSNDFFKFYEQVKQEAHKVVWSSKKELITSVIIVVMTVLAFSMICLVLDYTMHSLVSILLRVGK